MASLSDTDHTSRRSQETKDHRFVDEQAPQNGALTRIVWLSLASRAACLLLFMVTHHRRIKARRRTAPEAPALPAAVLSRCDCGLFLGPQCFDVLIADYDTSPELGIACTGPEYIVPVTWGPGSRGGVPLLSRLLQGLMVWDSVHFVSIAKCGYEFENQGAFFPFVPLASEASGGPPLAQTLLARRAAPEPRCPPCHRRSAHPAQHGASAGRLPPRLHPDAHPRGPARFHGVLRCRGRRALSTEPPHNRQRQASSHRMSSCPCPGCDCACISCSHFVDSRAAPALHRGRCLNAEPGYRLPNPLAVSPPCLQCVGDGYAAVHLQPCISPLHRRILGSPLRPFLHVGDALHHAQRQLPVSVGRTHAGHLNWPVK